MKNFLFIFLIFFASVAFAADTKMTALPENTAPISTDILHLVDDPGGTPANQYTTVANLLGGYLIDFRGLSPVAGDLIYFDGANFVVLNDGAAGTALYSDGDGTFSWTTPGDVVGPASATDSVPVLFDGTTGKLVKNSTPTGTGNPVLANSPTLVTPNLGDATAEGIEIAGTSSGGQYIQVKEDTDNGSNFAGHGVYGDLAHSTLYMYPLAAPTAGQTMVFAVPGNQTMADGETRSVSVGTWILPLANVVEDTTPQLGGALDGQANDITTTGEIKGRLEVGADITGNTSHDTSELHNTLYMATAAATVTLDAAADAGYGATATYFVRDASEALVLDPQAGEKIRLDGVALAAGTAVTGTGVDSIITIVAITDTDGSGTDGYLVTAHVNFESE